MLPGVVGLLGALEFIADVAEFFQQRVKLGLEAALIFESPLESLLLGFGCLGRAI